MLRQYSMLCRLSVLQLAYPDCKNFSVFGSSAVMAVSKSSMSTVKVKQPVKHHKINHQQLEGNSQATSRLMDPIRPVADRLLVSVMKRHKEKFAGLASSRELCLSAAVLSSLSTPDLIHVIYSTPQNLRGRLIT